MRSFFLACVFLFSGVFLAAEEMQFVTLLSQPVGSFSKVELLDASKPAEIFHLNFCNTDAQGEINVAASSSSDAPNSVDAEKLRVLSGATLGGQIKSFNLNTGNRNIYIGKDGSFSGFAGGTLRVTSTNPAVIIVDDSLEDSSNYHTGQATFKYISSPLKISQQADFYTMLLQNAKGRAFMSSPAEGDTKVKDGDLSWAQVAPKNTTDAPQAFILTSHEGYVYSGEDDEDYELGDPELGEANGSCTWNCGELDCSKVDLSSSSCHSLSITTGTPGNNKGATCYKSLGGNRCQTCTCD